MDLITKLTGLKAQKRKRLGKLLRELAVALEEADVIVFGGGCNDEGLLVDRKTGIMLDHAGKGHFGGGDWNGIPFTESGQTVYFNRYIAIHPPDGKADF